MSATKECFIFLCITKGPMLVKSILYECEMAANLTVAERDVTVLHLSCPRRENVTFKPTGREQGVSDFCTFVSIISMMSLVEGSNAPVSSVTNTIPSCVCVCARRRK